MHYVNYFYNINEKRMVSIFDNRRRDLDYRASECSNALCFWLGAAGDPDGE